MFDRENELVFAVQMDISLGALGSSEVVLFYNPDPDGLPIIHSYDLDPNTADSVELGFEDTAGTFISMKNVTTKDHESGNRLFVGQPGWHVAAKATDAAAAFVAKVAVSGGIGRS